MCAMLRPMSDSVSSVRPVGGRVPIYEIPPVTPVVGRPMPVHSSTSSGPSVRADKPQGSGRRVDMYV
jgi:hypothetical protein